MHWRFTPFALPAAVSAVITLFMGLVAWRRRPAPGATSLTLLIGAVIYWNFWSALELCGVDRATKVLAVRMSYIGIVSVLLLWLVFVLEYTNRSYLITRKNLFWLALTPGLFLILLWTNESHGLVWRAVELDASGPIPALKTTRGIGYWVYAAYGYSLLATGAILLWRALLRSPDLHRGQFVALLVATLAPWASNVLFMLKLSPVPNIDLTPAAFCIAGAALALGAFRYQLLDIVPVARDAVIENMLDSVVVLDGRNRIVDLNPSAQRLLGSAYAELIGQPAERILSRWPDVVRGVSQSSDVRAEIVLDEEGRKRYFDLSISPLRDRRERITGRLLVLHDATERIQARQAAEAANQAKSAYLSMMSHELRTPLTSVLGFAKLVKKRLDEVVFPAVATDGRRVQRAIKQVGSNMEIIVFEGERLTKLINDVLDLAKIEAGMVAWRTDPVWVQEVVQQSTAATAALFEGEPLELAVDVEEGLPPLTGDRDRLIQVMVNLISNAVKFTEAGSVTCRARQRGNEIMVSVIDTGIGIEPGDYDKVFEQFVQVGDTLADRPRGTGLGLPICKNIVERHGGRIWVESEGVPGRGSNFTFTLPISTSESSRNALENAPRPRHGGGSGGNRREGGDLDT